MKKTYFTWREDIKSFDKLAESKSQRGRGVLRGFNVPVVSIVGNTYVITLGHSSNFIDIDGAEIEDVGSFISPQGLIHQSDETIEVSFDRPTVTGRIYTLVATLPYTQVVGFNDNPTYYITHNTSTLDPAYDTPILVMHVKYDATAAISIDDITSISRYMSTTGATENVRAIGNSKNNYNKYPGINMISNIINMHEYQYVRSTDIVGDPNAADISDRPVLLLGETYTYSKNKISKYVSVCTRTADCHITDILFSSKATGFPNWNPIGVAEPSRSTSIHIHNEGSHTLKLGLKDTFWDPSNGSPFLHNDSEWGASILIGAEDEFIELAPMESIVLDYIRIMNITVSSSNCIGNQFWVPRTLRTDRVHREFEVSLNTQINRLLDANKIKDISQSAIGDLILIRHDGTSLSNRMDHRVSEVFLLNEPPPGYLLKDWSGDMVFGFKFQCRFYVRATDNDESISEISITMSSHVDSIIKLEDLEGNQMYYGFPEEFDGTDVDTFNAARSAALPKNAFTLSLSDGYAAGSTNPINTKRYTFNGFSDTSKSLAQRARTYQNDLPKYPTYGDNTYISHLQVLIEGTLTLKKKHFVAAT